MPEDTGASASPSGSHPSGHAASGVDGASRFDPSRIEEFRKLGLCTGNPAPCAAPSSVPSPGATVTFDPNTGGVTVKKNG